MAISRNLASAAITSRSRLLGHALIGALLFQVSLPLFFNLPGTGVCAAAQQMRFKQHEHTEHVSDTSEQLAACLCALMGFGKLTDPDASSNLSTTFGIIWHDTTDVPQLREQTFNVAASYHWISRAPPALSDLTA